MRVRSLIVIFLALAALGGLATHATAQNALERLVMPGELIKGHAKLEQDCNSCHKPFSKESQDQLCLDCHKPVAADIKSGRGMHGLRKDVAANACKHCHTEHKGRAADIVQLDRETFDHKTTTFALLGRHVSVKCDSCHQPGKKFREAASGCIDCHRKDNPHKGQTGDKCDSCHTSDAWRSLKPYDHAKTRFPLTGSHQQVECKACHIGERYKPLAMACVDCHKQKDVHNGRNGPKCEGCHTTTLWRAVAFDHDANTKFPLIGKHRTTACETCHKEDPRRVKLETACISCHQKDDAKAHNGSLGKDCLKCHDESSWKSDVKFDHAQTRFPLLGKHAEAKCEDCHKSKAYKTVATTCLGCHQKKDVHEGRLGANCAQCHNSSAWKRAAFDHDKQTHFKLTGKHRSATCYACHNRKHVEKASLATDCYSCHKAQDTHRGAFGRDCAKCHTTATFSTAYIRK